MNEPDDDATLDEVIGGIDVPAYVEEYIDQYRAICQRDPDRGGGYKAVGKARDALRDAIRRAIYDAEQAERSALAHAARGEAVRSWRDVEGTLPARRDGDKVARVDEVVPAFLDPTPPPATGEAERCEDHGREGCIDCESATGEAGTSEVEKARAAVVDAAKARRAFEEGLDGVSVHPGADRERHRWYVAAENASIDALLAAEARAMPEAREGGRSVP